MDQCESRDLSAVHTLPAVSQEEEELADHLCAWERAAFGKILFSFFFGYVENVDGKRFKMSHDSRIGYHGCVRHEPFCNNVKILPVEESLLFGSVRLVLLMAVHPFLRLLLPLLSSQSGGRNCCSKLIDVHGPTGGQSRHLMSSLKYDGERQGGDDIEMNICVLDTSYAFSIEDLEYKLRWCFATQDADKVEVRGRVHETTSSYSYDSSVNHL
jgi:hypothetical protein